MRFYKTFCPFCWKYTLKKVSNTSPITNIECVMCGKTMTLQNVNERVKVEREFYDEYNRANSRPRKED